MDFFEKKKHHPSIYLLLKKAKNWRINIVFWLDLLQNKATQLDLKTFCEVKLLFRVFYQIKLASMKGRGNEKVTVNSKFAKENPSFQPFCKEMCLLSLF